MALIPPFFLDCVVAIWVEKPDETKQWIGTGFLFGKFTQQKPDNQKEYEMYLVTNKHVLDNQNDIILRFNAKWDSPAKDYPVKLTNQEWVKIWTGHPNEKIDVAVLWVDVNLLDTEGMNYNFFRSDDTVFTKDDLIKMETTEGDYVYVLGFPMGLVGIDRQHVILRNWSIARIRDLFENRSTDFMVDALVFPGNSWWPVVLRPEMMSIQSTKSNSKAGLIWVIKSYIPYQDIAISQQTNRPRIIFEDNSGLSLVEPVDYIIEAISEDKRVIPRPERKTE